MPAVYDRIASMSELSTILNSALKEFNETNAAMDLVLFDDAMLHVVRISRVLNQTAGHALVVGVGGSGKQSLTKLASFVNGCSIMSLSPSSTYDVKDLKTDLRVRKTPRRCCSPASRHQHAIIDNR